MHRFIAPAAVAAALVAAIAVPTAAQAATRSAPVPEIGAVFSSGDHTSVYDGIAEMSFAPRMGFGSATGETGFDDARVVVRDEDGKQVCSTATNDFATAGGWGCYATPKTLSVGVHTVRAVAYDEGGDASAASKPVRVTITGDDGSNSDDAAAQPVDGAVDSGFTAPGGTAQPAPGDVDAGFTAPGAGNGGDEGSTIAKPEVTCVTPGPPPSSV